MPYVSPKKTTILCRHTFVLTFLHFSDMILSIKKGLDGEGSIPAASKENWRLVQAMMRKSDLSLPSRREERVSK